MQEKTIFVKFGGTGKTMRHMPLTFIDFGVAAFAAAPKKPSLYLTALKKINLSIVRFL